MSYRSVVDCIFHKWPHQYLPPTRWVGTPPMERWRLCPSPWLQVGFVTSAGVPLCFSQGQVITGDGASARSLGMLLMESSRHAGCEETHPHPIREIDLRVWRPHFELHSAAIKVPLASVSSSRKCDSNDQHIQLWRLNEENNIRVLTRSLLSLYVDLQRAFCQQSLTKPREEWFACSQFPRGWRTILTGRCPTDSNGSRQRVPLSLWKISHKSLISIYITMREF